MQTLPVVRVYDFEEEIHYVVRRNDGTPLAVPTWMTVIEAAHVNIVPAARLPSSVLLELHRIVATCLSNVHNVHQEDCDAANASKMSTPTLRRNTSPTRRKIPSGGTRATAPGTDAVDAGIGDRDPGGEQR
jgi:hypothetical protein